MYAASVWARHTSRVSQLAAIRALERHRAYIYGTFVRMSGGSMSASQVAQTDPIKEFLKVNEGLSSDWGVVSHILAWLPDIVTQICKPFIASGTERANMRVTLREVMEGYIDSMILLMIKRTNKNNLDHLKSLLINIVEIIPDVLRIKKLRDMPIHAIEPFIDEFRKLLPRDKPHLLYCYDSKYDEALEKFKFQVVNTFGRGKDREACNGLMEGIFLNFVEELSPKNDVVLNIIGSTRRNMNRGLEDGPDPRTFRVRFYERLIGYDDGDMSANDVVCYVILDIYTLYQTERMREVALSFAKQLDTTSEVYKDVVNQIRKDSGAQRLRPINWGSNGIAPDADYEGDKIEESEDDSDEGSESGSDGDEAVVDEMDEEGSGSGDSVDKGLVVDFKDGKFGLLKEVVGENEKKDYQLQVLESPVSRINYTSCTTVEEASNCFEGGGMWVVTNGANYEFSFSRKGEKKAKRLEFSDEDSDELVSTEGPLDITIKVPDGNKGQKKWENVHMKTEDGLDVTLTCKLGKQSLTFKCDGKIRVWNGKRWIDIKKFVTNGGGRVKTNSIVLAQWECIRKLWMDEAAIKYEDIIISKQKGTTALILGVDGDEVLRVQYILTLVPDKGMADSPDGPGAVAPKLRKRDTKKVLTPVEIEASKARRLSAKSNAHGLKDREELNRDYAEAQAEDLSEEDSFDQALKLLQDKLVESIESQKRPPGADPPKPKEWILAMSKIQDLAALRSCIVRGEQISIPPHKVGFERGIKVDSWSNIYEYMDAGKVASHKKISKDSEKGIRDVFQTYIRPIMFV
jgi:hypothetical protein